MRAAGGPPPPNPTGARAPEHARSTRTHPTPVSVLDACFLYQGLHRPLPGATQGVCQSLGPWVFRPGPVPYLRGHTDESARAH
jgi:hypothetical protein